MNKKNPVVRFVFLIAFLVLFSLYVLFYTYVLSRPAVGTETDSVVAVEGSVVYDSSLSKNGNHIMTVYLSRAENVYGNVVDARGLVTAVSTEYALVTCGEKVRLTGKFSDSLFLCSQIEVIRKLPLSHLRQLLIQAVEKRILGNDPSSGDYLSSALLLGRAESANLSVKELARTSGCIHVLALSGMHLNVISMLCRKLFGKKHIGRLISGIAVSLFVFIAGPRPSLIRALLMFYFSFLDSGPRLTVAFLVQLLLFPLTMMNTGSLFGYAAVFALIYCAPYVSQLLNFRLPFPLINILLTSYTVILFTSPVSVIVSDTWYWSSVFASPICSLLVTVCMAEGLLGLLFGNFMILSMVKEYTYLLIERVLSFFSLIPASDSRHLWLLYVPLMIMLTLRVSVFGIHFRERRLKVRNLRTKDAD